MGVLPPKRLLERFILLPRVGTLTARRPSSFDLVDADAPLKAILASTAGADEVVGVVLAPRPLITRRPFPEL